jgi:hypothetical protein
VDAARRRASLDHLKLARGIVGQRHLALPRCPAMER